MKKKTCFCWKIFGCHKRHLHIKIDGWKMNISFGDIISCYLLMLVSGMVFDSQENKPKVLPWIIPKLTIDILKSNAPYHPCMVDLPAFG